MEKIFDIHAHYDDEAFDDDRESLISSMLGDGVVGIINGATDIESARLGIELSKKYRGFYTSAGYHPETVHKAPQDYIERLAELLKEPSAVAVGEIGLDYHWDTSPRDFQRACFEKQLALAKELDLPVVVHDREAHGDTFELLKKYRPKGVVHCFSGSAELAEQTVRLGMSISLGGAVTFKNARKSVEVAREIPLDRLMLETDAPYMSPVPFRGKRCDSRMIKYTAEKIAEIRNIGVEELLKRNIENACLMFGITV